MSALDINHYETDTADGRGRANVGTDRAGSEVTYVVLNPDSLERLDGPRTKSVQSDGRLSLGSKFANREVTVGILKASGTASSAASDQRFVCDECGDEFDLAEVAIFNRGSDDERVVCVDHLKPADRIIE